MERKFVVRITHFAKFNIRFHPSPVANTQDPISLRLPTELHIRLQAAGDRLGIPKHSLAQMAIKAAIEAVENAHGRLVLPIEFKVRYTPNASTKTVIKPKAK